MKIYNAKPNGQMQHPDGQRFSRDNPGPARGYTDLCPNFENQQRAMFARFVIKRAPGNDGSTLIELDDVVCWQNGGGYMMGQVTKMGRVQHATMDRPKDVVWVDSRHGVRDNVFVTRILAIWKPGK